MLIASLPVLEGILDIAKRAKKKWHDVMRAIDTRPFQSIDHLPRIPNYEALKLKSIWLWSNGGSQILGIKVFRDEVHFLKHSNKTNTKSVDPIGWRPTELMQDCGSMILPLY